jgi:hypothetical protein
MRTIPSIAAVVAVASTVVTTGQGLRPPTATGWEAYIVATEARVSRERGEAIPPRPGVERGEVFIEQLKTSGPSGELEVPDAAVHHWRGTVLVPGARLEDVVSRLEREPPDTRQQDVLSSSVLALRPGWMKVAVRVHRQFLVSAVFDTEHEVAFERHGASRASSWSRATKIVEIADAGTPKERPKGEKEDRDLLWKWHAYWRYEQAGRGVVVECESITLSRPVPMLLKPIAGPLVNKVARESMERSLIALRERFKAPAPPPPPKAAAALPASPPPQVRRAPHSGV